MRDDHNHPGGAETFLPMGNSLGGLASPFTVPYNHMEVDVQQLKRLERIGSSPRENWPANLTCKVRQWRR